MRALIIYASTEGQTQKIAEYLGEQLHQNGIPADTYNLADDSADEVAIDRYDAVLIGSSIHYANYDNRIQSCIRDNIAILKKMPSAFFSVSLGIHSEHAVDRTEVAKLTEAFLAKSDFAPDMTAYIAGALRYSRYGWIKKRLMRWIANHNGENDKDFSTDHEYTDWNAIDDFARQFSSGLNATNEKGGTLDLPSDQQVEVVRAGVSVYVEE